MGGGKCGAFSYPCVGSYCIRPTNDPFMGRMIQMIDRRCAFLSPAGPFGGAYTIRPYRVTRKMIAVGVCSAVLPEKQAAFGGCYGVGGGKCGAFSCLHVGAYCIRLTNVPFMGRMIQMIDRRCAFLSPAGPFCGAYAIRPYRDGRKMIAVGACSIVLPQKQAAFRGCYAVGGGKCGAFSCSRVGAYCIRPINDPFMGRMIQMIDLRCAFLSPAGPFGGAYAIRPYRDGRKMIAAGVCSAALPEK